MHGIYPDNFEVKTGFDKIRELLDARCLSTLGKELVEEMQFSSDHELLSRLHGETFEFTRIIREFGQFPVSFFIDVRPAIHQ